jgi:hypothetical protein
MSNQCGSGDPSMNVEPSDRERRYQYLRALRGDRLCFGRFAVTGRLCGDRLCFGASRWRFAVTGFVFGFRSS